MRLRDHKGGHEEGPLSVLQHVSKRSLLMHLVCSSPRASVHSWKADFALNDSKQAVGDGEKGAAQPAKLPRAFQTASEFGGSRFEFDS